MFCRINGVPWTVKSFFFNVETSPKATALSVVSMELWSPHKMAEISPRRSNEGVPDPRMEI